jgi:electron transport complex protein RnfE
MSMTDEKKAKTDWARIARDGIWDNNVVLAQSLALCPLLAVTGTATNGLGLGLATTFVMVQSGAAWCRCCGASSRRRCASRCSC